MTHKVFFNDCIIDASDARVSVYDLALHRAYGIFDYFKMLDGYNPYLELYLDRFYKSLTLAGLEISYTRSEIKHFLDQLLATNYLPACGVKVIVTAGVSQNGFDPDGQVTLIMIPYELHRISPSVQQSVLVDIHYMRDIPEIKTINYMFPAMHASLLKKFGAADFVFHDGQYFYESSRCNVFIVKNKIIYTPGENILKGITRQRVLDCASQGFEIVVPDRVPLSELFTADEVFVSSTTKNILPITRIRESQIGNGQIGEITCALQNLVKDW